MYQGIIPVPSDDQVNEWREVVIPFDQFHLTFRGYLEEPCVPFDGRDVKHIGFMMAERKSGPFRMEVDHVSVCQSTRLKSRRYTGLHKHYEDDDL